MSLQHPIARVRGLGSAKSGSQHWWLQRVTAVALVLLSPWFLVLSLSLVGADQAATRAALAQPFNAICLLQVL